MNCERERARGRESNRDRERLLVCAAVKRFLASAGWTDYLKLRARRKTVSERERKKKRGQKGHSDLRIRKMNGEK